MTSKQNWSVKPALASVAIILVVHTFFWPYIVHSLTGASYTDGVATRALTSTIFISFALIIWFVLRPLVLNVLHADRGGNMPWYASPVIILPPLLVYILYIMLNV